MTEEPRLDATTPPQGDPALAAVWDQALADDDPCLYANREFSWLDFNARVLNEADDPRNPLLERVRFLAITSSNLDEFYAKRIAWLKQALRASPNRRTVDGLTLSDQYGELVRRCAVMRRSIEDRWRGILAPALAAAGVRIVEFASLELAERRRLEEYFMSSVYPVLTPLVVDPSHPFPFISASSVSLALRICDPRTGIERFGRVKVPQNRPRFIEAGEGRFVLLEDLIAGHLHVLFPGVDVVEHSMLRVLRSIEIETASGEAAEDLLDLVEREVRRRRLADAVCLEVTGPLTADREELLLEELNLVPSDIVVCDGPLGLTDLQQIAGLARPDLTYPPIAAPAVPPAFANVTDRAMFFSALHGEDIMLVVEDDEAIAEVVAYQLTRNGHTVAVAHDGMQALEHLTHDQIDLVILDLMLPRLSGLEVLRVLRRDSDTPVIILSARDGDADQVAALDLGADDYVTKPFSMRQLLARVSAVMRRAAPVDQQEAPAPECDVVIDGTQHEVRKRGQIIPLAPKEFELLVFLAERANRVCSRDAVLNAVWGYGYEGETRTVDVHVHWLRRKLEDDPSNPQMLVTIRQYGYKLVTQRPGHPPQIAVIGGSGTPERV